MKMFDKFDNQIVYLNIILAYIYQNLSNFKISIEVSRELQHLHRF